MYKVKGSLFMLVRDLTLRDGKGAPFLIETLFFFSFFFANY